MAADMMFLNILIVTVSLVYFKEVSGLKCRVDHDERTQDGFTDVVRACMNVDFRDEENNNNNPHRNNNNNNWQYRPQWGQDILRFPTKDRGEDGRRQENEDEDEQDGSREEAYGRGGGRPRGYRPHASPRPRSRRATPPRSNFGPRPNNTRRHPGSSSLEDVEPCAIHCIFRQMKMLDSNNQPDKPSVLGVMTGRLRDPTLRAWLRDTISECFDMLDSGTSENPDTKCSMTKNFALCLEQKGQQSCEDWDDEIRKPGQKQTNFGPNKHRG